MHTAWVRWHQWGLNCSLVPSSQLQSPVKNPCCLQELLPLKMYAGLRSKHNWEAGAWVALGCPSPFPWEGWGWWGGGGAIFKWMFIHVWGGRICVIPEREIDSLKHWFFCLVWTLSISKVTNFCSCSIHRKVGIKTLIHGDKLSLRPFPQGFIWQEICNYPQKNYSM